MCLFHLFSACTCDSWWTEWDNNRTISTEKICTAKFFLAFSWGWNGSWEVCIKLERASTQTFGKSWELAFPPHCMPSHGVPGLQIMWVERETQWKWRVSEVTYPFHPHCCSKLSNVALIHLHNIIGGIRTLKTSSMLTSGCFASGFIRINCIVK